MFLGFEWIKEKTIQFLSQEMLMLFAVKHELLAILSVGVSISYTFHQSPKDVFLKPINVQHIILYHNI